MEDELSPVRSELLQVSEDIYKTNEMIHDSGERDYYRLKALILDLRRKIDCLMEPSDFVPILEILDSLVTFMDGKIKYQPEIKELHGMITQLKNHYRE